MSWLNIAEFLNFNPICDDVPEESPSNWIDISRRSVIELNVLFSDETIVTHNFFDYFHLIA